MTLEFSTRQWIDNRYAKIKMVGGSSGGGGPTGTTTTTSNTSPWSGQQPYLLNAFSSAQNLFNQGGPQYFPGQTVASQSPQTQAGIQALTDFGTNPSPVEGAATNATTNALNTSPTFSPGNDVLNSLSTSQNPGLGYAGGLAGGSLGLASNNGIGVGLQGLNNVVGTSMGTPTAAGNLGTMASGGLLNNDPNLSKDFDQIAGQITNAYQTSTAPGITGNFNKAGRFGSGAQTNAQGQGQLQLANALSSAGANLVQQNYENQTANMLGANNAITQAQLGYGNLGLGAGGALLQGGTNAGLGLGSLINSTYGTQGQLNLGASTALGNNYANNEGNLSKMLLTAPTTAQMPLTNAAALTQAGSAQDAFNQANINANIGQWNYNQLQPYQNLASFEGFINGNYGGQTVTQQPYFSNQGQQMFGNALGLGSLGLGAYSAGLFSDKRLKDDIEPLDAGDIIDELEPVKWNWKHDGSHGIGLIAQDVEEVIPDAVSIEPMTGMRMIDYAKIVPILIASHQQMNAKIRALEAALKAKE